MRRAIWRVSALAFVGVAIGAWVALRANGYLGGLDHDGPLRASVGNEADFVCRSDRGVEWNNDDLKNLGHSAITIDRISPNGPPSETGFTVSKPQTFAVVPPDPITRVNKHAQPPRRPAKGTVIPGRGISGISYFMRYDGKPSLPRSSGSTTFTFTVSGVTVDYHVGSRHFREATGTVVQTRCRATKK